MGNRFQVSILILTVLTVGALFLGAQSRGTNKPDLRSAPPDLTGVWHPQGQSMDLAKLVVPGDQMLLTPYGEQRLRTVDGSISEMSSLWSCTSRLLPRPSEHDYPAFQCCRDTYGISAHIPPYLYGWSRTS